MPRSWPEKAGIIWITLGGFLLLLGLAKGIPPLILLATIIFSAFICNLVLATSPLKRLHAQVTDDGELVAGDPGLVVFQIWSDTASTADLQFHLTGVGGWSGLPTRLTPGQPCTLRLAVYPTQRGWMSLPVLEVASSYPFGLVGAARNLCGQSRVLVEPAAGLVQLPGLMRFLEKRHSRQEVETRATRAQHASTGEFHGLRPWRAGDSRRLIHWRTSARLGQPMVREHEAPGRQGLLLLVDPGSRIDLPATAEREDLERMIRLAAGVARMWLRGSERWLGLVVAGGQPAFVQAQGAAGEGERSLLRALALCEPSQTPVAWPEMPANLPGDLLALRLHQGESGEPAGRWARLARRDLPASAVATLTWFQDVRPDRGP